MPNSTTNGKVCYLEIPAVDIADAVEFYRNVFGWAIAGEGTA